MSRQCHVRVLHIFGAACNLINEAGEVISLVSPQIGDGPFNIVVPDIRFADHLSPTDPIAITPDALTIGSLTIHTTSAHLWNPRPPWKALHESHFLPSFDGGRWPAGSEGGALSHLPLLLDILHDQAPADSLSGLLFHSLPSDLDRPHPPNFINSQQSFSADSPRPKSAKLIGEGLGVRAIRQIRATPDKAENYSTTILHTARQPAAKLITGLNRSDRALCLEGVTGLAGLGSGLTPSGDDWLIGCMLAIWAISDQPTIPPTAIAQTAAPLTTPLSAAWLHAAARGECGIRWHTLINALTTDNHPAITQAAKAVIHQGHTSGADALAGFIALLASR